MTVKAMTLNCVLLDASVIIEAHRLKAWQTLIEKVEVLVPSIVAFDESLFFSRVLDGIPEAIWLRGLIEQGKIKLVDATVDQMKSAQAVFDRVFVKGLHDGELEALALIKSNMVNDALFCTSDAPAIRALAMIGHSSSGISMEILLRKTGLKKALDVQFSERYFRDNLEIGKQNLITGQGLRG